MTDETENGQTSEGAATKTRRKSGTGFPVVSLAEAAPILKEAGKYGFEHSTAAFASYMGHSTTNSGAFRQRLAAFRDWKLITGRGDNLAMTEIGKVIALPPDEETEGRALRDAFHNYAAFSKLHEGSAKGTPLTPKNLGNRAVHDFGVAPGSATKFIQSFVDSAVVAGLAEVAEDGQVTLLTPDDEPSGAPPPVEGMGAVASQAAPPRSALPRSGAPGIRQTWRIPGGTITFEIRSDEPLPASAFATVGEVVASLENLARTFAPESAGPKGPDDVAEERE